MSFVNLEEKLKPYSVRISKDFVYGAGEVRASAGSSPTLRDLKLDIYQPIMGREERRPAVILAFGGAFHRGSKEDDAFGELPHRNNSISWYCHEFARRGYVACSIDYRLVTEDPSSGSTPRCVPAR